PRPARRPPGAAGRGEALRPLRPRHDPPLRGALGGADHPGGEPARLRAQDLRPDRRHQPAGRRDLPRGPAEAEPHPFVSKATMKPTMTSEPTIFDHILA